MHERKYENEKWNEHRLAVLLLHNNCMSLSDRMQAVDRLFGFAGDETKQKKDIFITEDRAALQDALTNTKAETVVLRCFDSKWDGNRIRALLSQQFRSTVAQRFSDEVLGAMKKRHDIVKTVPWDLNVLGGLVLQTLGLTSKKSQSPKFPSSRASTDNANTTSIPNMTGNENAATNENSKSMVIKSVSNDGADCKTNPSSDEHHKEKQWHHILHANSVGSWAQAERIALIWEWVR